MQTGPAAKQSMDRWLLWTGVMEIGNAVLFTVIVWFWDSQAPDTFGSLTFIGLVTLNALLVEGGFYWLLKRSGFFDRSQAPRTVLMLRALYALNTLLLLVFPASLLTVALGAPAVNPYDALIGLGFYLFAVGEFVYYFVVKINMRPGELRLVIRERRPVPARLRRELEHARLATRRSPT